MDSYIASLAPRVAEALRLSGMLLVSGLAIGCATPERAPLAADVSFLDRPAFRFRAGEIEVVRAFEPSPQTGNLDWVAVMAPSALAQRWVKERVRAAGGPLQVRFVIRAAELTEENLPVARGLRGAFTTDQAQRYRGIIDVDLEVRDERGRIAGKVSARVERQQSVAEGITAADRTNVLASMLAAMARDLDLELERNIESTLPGFIAQEAVSARRRCAAGPAACALAVAR